MSSLEAKVKYHRKTFRRILETKEDGSLVLGPEEKHMRYMADGSGFAVVIQGRPIDFLEKNEVVTILKEANHGKAK